ncbi:hydroxyproline-rich glycoprotein family protein [Prunus dulcis]|uniref:Hydroxyproline-rich glycoprotein family protein n=1 Tax=Prunus dulcis TaxID=3755 RepID=A0A4Y1RS03_PRUDU|nr:hydroxyproline-rich glycoprotein family protein [Prunus dulcis]
MTNPISSTQNQTLAPLSPPHHMSQGRGHPHVVFVSSTASDSSDGEPGFFATPRGCISAVLGLPSWHSTPLDHHLQASAESSPAATTGTSSDHSDLKQKQRQSLPVIMPGDQIPKFMALPCPESLQEKRRLL